MAYRSPARWLAPLALMLAVVAVFAIVSAGGSSPEDPAPARSATAQSTTSRPASERRRRARTYVVKPGDVLSSIAQKTGVSLERLQRLNPRVDAQTLRPGQRLKLAP